MVSKNQPNLESASVLPDPSGSLLKIQITGPQPRVTDRVSWRLGPKICIHSSPLQGSETTGNRQHYLLDHEMIKNKLMEKSM